MSLTENQDFLDLLKASMEAMKMEPDYGNFKTVSLVSAEPGWKTRPSELEIDDNDFNPSNFGMWTDMNLSSQADFLEDIIHKHGNPVGEYSSLSEILDALRLGQRYAMRFRRYTELHSASSELKLEIRERVTKNLDILRKRAECDMLPAPIACSLIVEIQMCLEQLWGVGNANL